MFQGAADADLCAMWLGHIDAAGALDARVSSLPMDAVAGLDAATVWSALAVPVRAWCAAELGAVAIDVDQCWIRRQHAPTTQPHSWHQDGALRFDFLAGAAPTADALLRMVTCWIALTPCGTEAPGLELLAMPMERMLTPAELRDDAVEARWAHVPRLRPLMGVGDAALFTGHVLHRTHVDDAMTRSRTSIELRCFPADDIPAQLGGDRFVVVAR